MECVLRGMTCLLLSTLCTRSFDRLLPEAIDFVSDSLLWLMVSNGLTELSRLRSSALRCRFIK